MTSPSSSTSGQPGAGPASSSRRRLEKLAEKYEGRLDVVKVDVDANPALSQAFNILSIPTIAYFKPGAQPQGVAGFRPMESYEQVFGLSELLTAPAPTIRGTRSDERRLTHPAARMG